MDNKRKDIILYISIFGIHHRLNDVPPNKTMTLIRTMNVNKEETINIYFEVSNQI